MTKITLTALLLAAAVSLSPVMTATAIAGEQPNVLVMGEDDDPDTVPRNHRVFDRVVQSLQSELGMLGFQVYDETAVSLDVTRQGRIRRSDAELITIAKRIQQPPIDVIAVFSIYVNVQQNINADIWDLGIRIPGRLLHVPTGRYVDSFEVDYPTGTLPPVPPNCLNVDRIDQDCLFEFVGGQAKRIAQDLGAVLAQKLDFQSPTGDAGGGVIISQPSTTGGGNSGGGSFGTASCTGMTTAYVISLRGFDLDEITVIEEYLVAFSGYDHHRPLRTTLTFSEYWYESCSDVSRLNRNLRLMLEQMGVQGRLAMTGNRFEIDKIGAPATR
ncbi:hypothetical protein [Devosia sp.]|jgi:hypothetical protein|uniref:hypothetical protein n=1 Tax=Devosia sp. TaxID=1871048 RepID=UPI0037C13CA5